MSTEIVPFRGKALAIASPELRDALSQLDEPKTVYPGTDADDPGLVIYRPFAPSPRAVMQAKVIADQVKALLMPASPEMVDDWLERLDGAFRKAAGSASWKSRRHAFHLVSGGLPGAAWTQESLAQGMARWSYLPSAAELHEFLTEFVKPIIARAQQLHRIATYQAPREAHPAPPMEIDPAERQAALNRAQVVKDDLLRQAAEKARAGARMLPDVTVSNVQIAASIRAQLERSDLTPGQREVLEARLKAAT